MNGPLLTRNMSHECFVQSHDMTQNLKFETHNKWFAMSVFIMFHNVDLHVCCLQQNNSALMDILTLNILVCAN